VGWHGLARSRIRYPLLANAVQRLLTAMVGQDREGTNRLQQAKWELTSRIRDESNVSKRIPFLPAITAFHAAPAPATDMLIRMETGRFKVFRTSPIGSMNFGFTTARTAEFTRKATIS
jgi:hypothetical protein